MASLKQWASAVYVALKDIVFPHSRTGGRGGFGRQSVSYSGSGQNWADRAGTLWHNSAVAACLYYLQDTFGEAPLVVRRRGNGGKMEIVPDHPVALLCRRPNPHYSGALLWGATILSLKVDGNAYWRIERDKYGLPLYLWYLPHWCVEPRYPVDGSVFISDYEYRPDGVPQPPIPVDDIIHFRDGLDPMNTRKGLSRLKAVLREVVADNEATTYTTAILQNMGVPGATAEIGGEVSPEGKEKFKRLWRAMTRGDARGDLVIVPEGTKITPFGFSPDDMALDKIRQVPESRICAALRVDPMVVSLSVGNGQRTFANMAEAREMTYEGTVIPLQDRCADELDTQLLPQLSATPDIEEVGFDRSGVRVLQADQDALYRRTSQVWVTGVATRNEARAMLSLPAVPNGDIFRTDISPVGNPNAPVGDTAKSAVKAAQEVLRSAATLRRLESGELTDGE